MSSCTVTNMEESCMLLFREQKTEDGKKELRLCTCPFLESSKEGTDGVCLFFIFHMLSMRNGRGGATRRGFYKKNCATPVKARSEEIFLILR